MSQQNKEQSDSLNKQIDLSDFRDISKWRDAIKFKYPDLFGERINQLQYMNIDNDNLDIDKALKVIGEAEYKPILLRVLNNVYYNEAGNLLTDITRTSVLLGFQSVRNVSLIFSLMHYILMQMSDNKIVQKEVALAVHSSLIACLMAKAKHKTRNVEATVIATMLFSVGKLIALYLGGDNSVLYCTQADKKELTEDDEVAIFGFKFNDLANEVSKVWNLGNLFGEIIHHDLGTHSNHFIFMARDLAQNLMHGWRSKSALSSIQSTEKWLGFGVTEMREFLLQSVEMAYEELDLYNHNELLDYIKLPNSESDELESSDDVDTHNAHPISAEIKDLHRELKNWHTKKTDKNYDALLKYSCKKMLSALDMDLITIAFITPDHNFIKGRYINEIEPSDFLERFQFEFINPEGWLFQHVLREKRAAWMGSRGEKVLRRYRNSDLTDKVGKSSFFMAPVVVSGKSIGLFFANRATSGRGLNTTTYDAFIDICHAVNVAIESLEKTNKSK
jgi:HD-like signal output (HDOD) protein